MSAQQPMLRLVQGDVGSGKTLVAARAALDTLSAGYQVAFMAPTELSGRTAFCQPADLVRSVRTICNLVKWSHQGQSSQSRPRQAGNG